MGSSAAKVGVFVVIALVLTAGIYIWLEGNFLAKRTTPITAEFESAQGITAGTVVRMAGVKIGEVERVELNPFTKRALVRMKIEERQVISPEDKITIASGGLLPAPYIEIVPLRKAMTRTPGVFQGTEAPTLDEIFPKAESLLDEATKLTRSLQTFVGDPRLMGNLKLAAANLAVTTEHGQKIAANLEKLTARGPAVMGTFERAGRSMEATLGEAHGALADSRGKIAKLLDQTAQAMDAMQKTLVEARSLIADEQTRENFRTTMANLRDMSASMRDASSSLKQTAGDVQGLTGDPKVQEDLRETVASMRSTMEQASELLARVNKIVGGGGNRTAGTRQRVRETDLRVDVQQTTSPGRPRVDVEATVPGGAGHFTRLGLHDFGEDTRLNFQFGRPLQDGLALRYGLHASRLGMGLDWIGPGGRVGWPRLSADVYGLDEPTLDLRAATRLRPDLELTFGVDRLFKDNAPVLGLRWHK